MDLNNIFLISNTFEDINKNILNYFVKKTNSNIGIIYHYNIILVMNLAIMVILLNDFENKLIFLMNCVKMATFL